MAFSVLKLRNSHKNFRCCKPFPVRLALEQQIIFRRTLYSPVTEDLKSNRSFELSVISISLSIKRLEIRNLFLSSRNGWLETLFVSHQQVAEPMLRTLYLKPWIFGS